MFSVFGDFCIWQDTIVIQDLCLFSAVFMSFYKECLVSKIGGLFILFIYLPHIHRSLHMI
jgi:hypothetical protein